MERFEAIVRGTVQGVWFRDFTHRNAHALKLLGETRNLPDGTVHVIAEGPRPHLDVFIERLREGPELAKVTAIDIVWQEPSGTYESFTIVRG